MQNKRARMNFWQDGDMQVAGFVASAIAVWRIVYRGAPLGVFVLAEQLTTRAGAAVQSLFSELSSFDQDLYGFAEYRYITETLQPPSVPSTDVQLPQPHIALNGVDFRYPETADLALRGVSLDIPFGSSIAIVGENGSGKTTLTKLLLGLYQPTSGQLLVNGMELAELNEAAWLARISVLLQDFGMNQDMTIRQAIWLGDITKPKTDEAIGGALQAAELAGIVGKLPHGLDTYLGKWIDEEKGAELSGGELQRLAIARALFRDSDILILDEPTSAIDANAKERIFRKLINVRRGKTTIFISHRFSTARRAEHIVFMHDGCISETGSHAELMLRRDKYYKMFTTQAEAYQ
ncbi:MAG: ATP-binding cassette domain-containing protein [Candidatus Saccharimonadales bacterium]